jgi:7-carboxy-7-deazaguanine synthase
MLRITEIFYSLQGESTNTGLPTIFIRLTGCPLRCQYCDTDYAFQGGVKKTFDEILSELQNYQCMRVCVTGGEPLAQKNCFPFLSFLADKGYDISLETSGAISLFEVDHRIMIVMDLKTPDSLEEPKNIYANVSLLKPKDQIKIVICSQTDFHWANQKLALLQIPEGVEVLYSPSHGQISPTDLAEWILSSQLNVRMQIQLHKILWQESQGR